MDPSYLSIETSVTSFFNYWLKFLHIKVFPSNSPTKLIIIWLLSISILISVSKADNCFNSNQFPIAFDIDNSNVVINSMDYNDVFKTLAFGGQANNMPFIGVFYDKAPIHRMTWMHTY